MKKLSKIEALENIVGKRGADYYLISTTDDFLNEYVPEYFLLMVDTHCRRKKSFQKYLKFKI